MYDVWWKKSIMIKSESEDYYLTLDSSCIFELIGRRMGGSFIVIDIFYYHAMAKDREWKTLRWSLEREKEWNISSNSRSD